MGFDKNLLIATGLPACQLFSSLCGVNLCHVEYINYLFLYVLYGVNQLSILSVLVLATSAAF